MYYEGMAVDVDIRELLGRDPFEPFRIRLSSGDHYDVRDPWSVAVLKSRIFVAPVKAEAWVFIPYLHIAALEKVASRGNGRPGRRRKRRE